MVQRQVKKPSGMYDFMLLFYLLNINKEFLDSETKVYLSNNFNTSIFYVKP